PTAEGRADAVNRDDVEPRQIELRAGEDDGALEPERALLRPAEVTEHGDLAVAVPLGDQEPRNVPRGLLIRREHQDPTARGELAAHQRDVATHDAHDGMALCRPAH